VASEILSRPPEEGARRLALGFLDAATAARARLDDSGDAEALHDFRVALRRLRSTFRAYRSTFAGSLSKKLLRRLRRLAAATGPGRDAEVQVTRLREEIPQLTRAQRAGAAWLLARLEGRMEEGYDAARKRAEEDLPRLAADLHERLSVYSTEVHLDADAPRPTFGQVAAQALRGQVEEVGADLAAIGGAGDVEGAHAARISAKRVRYLIEPLAGEIPGSAPLVKRFKALQDLLGELHDLHVFEAELGTALESAAAERARRLLAATVAADPAGEDGHRLRAARRHPYDAGLLALGRRARARRDELFAEMDQGYLQGGGKRFLGQLERLADRLEAAAAGEAPSPESAEPLTAPT
jgi:CHAD domain-containing protein